jgi:hypothetical protein
VAYDPAADASSVLVRERGGKTRTAFTGSGRVAGIAWSPDGRWLLVGWPAADQWLFLRTAGGRQVVTASALTAEFDPGGSGQGRFPRIVSWCC